MTHYTFEQFVEMNQIPDEERFEDCPICDGEGEHECECGDFHDCHECKGEGRIDYLRREYDDLCAAQEAKWNDWQKCATA